MNTETPLEQRHTIFCTHDAAAMMRNEILAQLVPRMGNSINAASGSMTKKKFVCFFQFFLKVLNVGVLPICSLKIRQVLPRFQARDTMSTAPYSLTLLLGASYQLQLALPPVWMIQKLVGIPVLRLFYSLSSPTHFSYISDEVLPIHG